MSDIYTTDPDRLLLDCAIGSVQAWKANDGDVAVNLSFYATFIHKADDMRSYTSSTHNLTIADARNIAAALITAADHAEALAAKDAA